MSGGIHRDQAKVTASGAFNWNDGNIGGVGSDLAQTDTTLNYGQTYHISGWTILPSSDGTRLTNDGTGMACSSASRTSTRSEREEPWSTYWVLVKFSYPDVAEVIRNKAEEVA